MLGRAEKMRKHLENIPGRHVSQEVGGLRGVGVGGHVPARMFDTKGSRTSAFAGLIAARAALAEPFGYTDTEKGEEREREI